jgi:hypothetical protein
MKLNAFDAGWPGGVGRLGLLLVLLVVAGCGSGRGKVSGRVLFQGEPLPGGSVYFRPADPRHNAVGAQLDEEGRYQVVLPVGEVRVSIDNGHLYPRPNLGRRPAADLPLTAELRKTLRSAKPAQGQPAYAPAAPSNPPGRYVRIPDKYRYLDYSGLQFTVGGGDQEQDFELTD